MQHSDALARPGRAGHEQALQAAADVPALAAEAQRLNRSLLALVGRLAELTV